MKNEVKLLLILLISYLLFGCGMFETTETDKIVEFRDKFIESLSDFEKSRADVNKKITNAFEIQPLLSQEKRDIVKISKKWEVNWKKVSEKFDVLYSKLNKIYNSAETYFAKLKERTNGISDTSMRSKQLDNIKQQREYWNELYKIAYNECNDFKLIIIEGDDYSRLFQTASYNNELEQKISELSELLERARKPIMELKQIKLDGTDILNGKYKPQTTTSDD